MAQRKQKSIDIELDRAAKRDLAYSGLQCAMKQVERIAMKPAVVIDDFQIFANFIASELRKIKDPTYAQATQRQLQKLLLQRMEEEPVYISAYISGGLNTNYFVFTFLISHTDNPTCGIRDS